MTGKRIISAGGMRQILTLVLLMPFLAFALVKPGTMLATDAQGRVMVILCGDSAPVEMAIAADGTMFPVKEMPGHGMEHGSCDWAPHAQTVLDADGVNLPLPGQVAMPIRPDLTGKPVVLAGMWQAPGARGPPAIL